MDTNKLKFTRLQNEIFSLLCLRAGEKLSQREIALLLKVSPTAIAKSIKYLEEKNIVKIEKTRTANLVSFNLDEKKAVQLKRVENLKNIYVSGLSNYLDEALAGGTIILFGSYALGEDTNNSDIDIAVIGRKDKILNLKGYEKILNKPINVNFYESWGKIHKDLKNNILRGILLEGNIEL